MNDEFGISSYRLEHSGNRKTFSRHKDIMLDNHLIETLQVYWPDEDKRRGTYYNTTPLGKVLAMKYWYNEFLDKKPLKLKTSQRRYPLNIWSKFSDAKKGKIHEDEPLLASDGTMDVKVKPDDLLVGFFRFLPRLKEFSKNYLTRGRASDRDAFSSALQFTFSEIDVNQHEQLPCAIEVRFHTKYETHVKIIKYFKLDDPGDIKKMYNYILDSITYLFLVNLEVMQKEFLDVENPVITKILEDPDLKSFREDYQMRAKSDLQESLNLLSDDN